MLKSQAFSFRFLIKISQIHQNSNVYAYRSDGLLNLNYIVDLSAVYSGCALCVCVFVCACLSVCGEKVANMLTDTQNHTLGRIPFIVGGITSGS